MTPRLVFKAPDWTDSTVNAEAVPRVGEHVVWRNIPYEVVGVYHVFDGYDTDHVQIDLRPTGAQG